MKLKFSIFILFTVLTGYSYGQELKQAPLNDEFAKFISSKTRRTGIIPSPNTYVFSDKISEDIAKFDFPTSYDLRNEGMVSAVKNQANAGHCWSFAAIGAIESRNLELGFPEYDLSEHNMATCHGFEWDEGGNQSIATAYLSRLSGPILEVEDPYNDYETSCSATGVTPQFYMPEARFLPSNPEVIKYMLMNYGAIAVSYFHDDSYYNQYDNTYYYSGTEDSPNHGVLLVGWDDNKLTASGSGAWIIKNSWGTTWGDDGFFYMSYDDSYAIFQPTLYPIRQEINNIDTLLMYDYLGAVSAYGYGDEDAYGLIKFNVSEDFNFNKIGTYVEAANSILDIEVFDTKNDNILTDTLASKYNVFVEYPGYYTFDLPFSASNDFYVKIKYHTPNDKYPIPVEMNIAGYAVPDIDSNVAWISHDGIKWDTIGKGTDTQADLCIRIYGSNALKASLTANEKTICHDGDVIFTSTSSGDITNYYWDFGKDANPATATTEGPHSVSYSSEGLKTIKLIIENASGDKDSIINYDYIDVNSEINVNIVPGGTYYIAKGDTLNLEAFGADSYVWYPSDYVIGSDTTQNTLQVNPDVETTIYVDGTKNSCISTDSLKIIVTEPPSNDSVCNAIALSLNEELGPYTNQYATVEDNEPHPTLGSCNTPLEWCDEGGLQNSIWFKFVAPSSGIVNIETDGFDNQIAVYNASNCADITSGDDTKYELLAANDDWVDDDYSATIDTLAGLTSGTTYWLQMDGSAGGDVGKCTISITEIKESTTSTGDDLNYQNIVKVYPNPNNGNFKLDLSSLQNDNEQVTVEILSTDGSVIQKHKYSSNEKEYDFSIKRSGMFIVRVTTLNNSYSIPVIIK